MWQQMSPALGIGNEGHAAPPSGNAKYSHSQVEIRLHFISQGTTYQLLQAWKRWNFQKAE